MTIYLDTSVIVSAFTNEVATATAHAFLRRRDAEAYLISDQQQACGEIRQTEPGL